MNRSLASFALALLLPPLAARCASEEIVVAELAPPAPAPSTSASGTPCQANADCVSPLSYCQKEACDAAAGVCRPRPLSCTPERDEQCGCDGVTYWNDCLRQQLGVARRAPGQCIGAGAARCGMPQQPPCSVPGASCARLLPPELACGPGAAGACWLLPPACPTSAATPSWEPCDDGPGPGPGPEPCVDACEAIRTAKPHRLHAGPGCMKGDPH